MSDIIQLLPDHIANQIAAGEVVQRPASVVKELMENSIDSGATKVHLCIKDAGKTLIQVTDNGCGMTATDARMSFERHATSKVKKANDLFNLMTKGFRGEALASIAAIAHVELKSKLTDEELGTKINIEGSKIIDQSPVSCANGTTISVKNLFFNVPARRNFLKSDAVENKHIIEEFLRVALVHNDIHFIFSNNDHISYDLEPTNLRKRIVGIYGDSMNKKIIPIEEETDIVTIKGFIGKPEFTKKQRGEQYLFVNNRYFKDSKLQHSIFKAYEDLIPSQSHPAYYIHFDVAPQSIDVNIHPTKTEIKFEHDREMYAILHSALKRALGQFNLTPQLDFEQEQVFMPDTTNKEVKIPTITVNPEFNPFNHNPSATGKSQRVPAFKAETNQADTLTKHQLYSEEDVEVKTEQMDLNDTEKIECIQLGVKYIIATSKERVFVFDQFRAHQRVIFDRLVQNLAQSSQKSQQLLFPTEEVLTPQSEGVLKEIKPYLKSVGFELEVGTKKLTITGIPLAMNEENPMRVIDEIIDEYAHNNRDFQTKPLQSICKVLSKGMAIKKNRILEKEEMENLVRNLFNCENMNHSPYGKSIFISITEQELENQLK